MVSRINRRRFLWAATSFGALAGLGLLRYLLPRRMGAHLCYALGLQGRLRVTYHSLAITSGALLPAPLVMAFVSDLHAGPPTFPGVFTRLLEALERVRPDVLLLGGDYVTTRAEHVAALVQVLARFKARLGTYAVLGNHDLWSDPGRQHIPRQLEESAGVKVLVNRNVALPHPFEQVSICGIDDPWIGSVDVARAFEGAGAVRIFLTHSPEGLGHTGQMRYDLALAGHTHGGQIAYPDGTPVLRLRGPLSRRYSRGRFEIKDNGPLIVSRGIGCSILPIRLNSDPELIVCTLHGSPATGLPHTVRT